jgi:hypothetical protein
MLGFIAPSPSMSGFIGGFDPSEKYVNPPSNWFQAL